MSKLFDNEKHQSSFWKKNSKNVPGNMKPVYGAQHPPIGDINRDFVMPTTPKKTKDIITSSGAKPKDSFTEFEEDTNDAWDDGDDDLITMKTNPNPKVSIRDAQSAAIQVMHDHSKKVQNAQQNSTAVNHHYNSTHHKTSSTSSVLSSSLPRSDKPAYIRLDENRRNSAANHDPSNRTVSPPTSYSQPTSPSYTSNTHASRTTPSPTAAPAARTGMSSGPSSPEGPGAGVRQPPNSHRISTHGHSATHIKQSHLTEREAAKVNKFESLLKLPSIDLGELKDLCWSGIPWKYRPVAWKILCGYLPPISDRQGLTLQRKRSEYFNYVEQYYESRHQEHQETYKQIQIDIPRMSPLIQIFQQEIVQQIFERILFIWAIRHPASGYVQGINDLVTPFFVVYLSEFLGDDLDLDKINVSDVALEHLRTVEADSFWCVSKLLDSIQDNYTFAQPGIQLKVNSLRDLTSRINSELHQHLEAQNVEYLQFSFRWMNNLLMREVPLRCTIRLWDTYMSEMSDFATFHLYVCAALLAKFSEDLLKERDFQGLMILLQNLPTHHWGNDEIGEMLADAYRLKFMFADAPSHLSTKVS